MQKKWKGKKIQVCWFVELSLGWWHSASQNISETSRPNPKIWDKAPCSWATLSTASMSWYVLLRHHVAWPGWGCCTLLQAEKDPAEHRTKLGGVPWHRSIVLLSPHSCTNPACQTRAPGWESSSMGKMERTTWKLLCKLMWKSIWVS